MSKELRERLAKIAMGVKTAEYEVMAEKMPLEELTEFLTHLAEELEQLAEEALPKGILELARRVTAAEDDLLSKLAKLPKYYKGACKCPAESREPFSFIPETNPPYCVTVCLGCGATLED